MSSLGILKGFRETSLRGLNHLLESNNNPENGHSTLILQWIAEGYVEITSINVDVCSSFRIKLKNKILRVLTIRSTKVGARRPECSCGDCDSQPRMLAVLYAAAHHLCNHVCSGSACSGQESDAVVSKTTGSVQTRPEQKSPLFVGKLHLSSPAQTSSRP